MYTPIHNHSRSYGNNRWFGYSPKLKRNVWTYSNLEYDHWVLVEMDPDVVTFCEQPLRITTGEHEAIFDMWLRRRDGSEEFREVKYSAALDPNTVNADFRSIQQVQVEEEWCRKNGYKFVLQTDKEIYKNRIYLDNMKTLLPYLRHHGAPVEADCSRIMRQLTSRPISLLELENAVGDLPPTRVLEAIAWLFVQRTIQANFDTEPIGERTEVWLNEETEDH